MTIRNLEHLLAPRSIALVGATGRPHSVGAILTANLVSGDFKGDIWLVNPKREAIGAARCYANIDALPGARTSRCWIA